MNLNLAECTQLDSAYRKFYTELQLFCSAKNSDLLTNTFGNLIFFIFETIFSKILMFFDNFRKSSEISDCTSEMENILLAPGISRVVYFPVKRQLVLA